MSLRACAACPTSNSEWFGTCIVSSLPDSVNDAISALLPEGRHPDPSLVNSNIFVQFNSGDKNNMSVTYLQSVAWNVNRMGYAKYSNGAISNPVYAVPATNSYSPSSGGCLQIGDTWQFGQFRANDMLIFFLDANQNSDNRFWSYFGPGIQNPRFDRDVCGNPGCTHSAWAYLTEYDLTIFGWEDGSLGDADYNDMVFYLTLQGDGFYNEVPPYENGTILICNNNTLVSWNSFTDVQCQSWGLLETATGGASCLTYMAIPAGWTWAPNDDTSKAIILRSYEQWSYTGASTCYLLKQTPTTAAGYRVVSGALQTCSATVLYITPGGQTIRADQVGPTTPLCYNAGCAARFVLKSISQSVACAAVPRCNSTVLANGAILAQSPSGFTEGVITLPDTATLYIGPSTTMNLQARIRLAGTDYSIPKVDIAVLGDFAVSGSQRSYIESSWNTVGASFRSIGVNAQFATFAFIPSGSSSSSTYNLISDYTFAGSAFAWKDSSFHNTGCGSGSAATTRGRNLVDAINTIANSAQLNWRPDSYRIIWVHTQCSLPSDAASGSTNLQAIQRTTGVVPVISYAGVSSSTPTFSSNAPWIYRTYYSGSSQTWDAPFRTYSFAPKRGAALFYEMAFDFFVVPSQGTTAFLTSMPSSPVRLNPDDGEATLGYQVKWPSSIPTTTSTLYFSATVQIIGRGTISYLIYFNHAPTLAGYTGTLPVSQATHAFTLTASDPDQGNQLQAKLVTAPSRGTLTVQGSSTVLTTSSNIGFNVFSFVYTPTSRTSAYTEEFQMSVSDGCASATATIKINVAAVNRPPVATNIVINMQEDQTGPSSTVNMNTYVTDPDGNALTFSLTGTAYVSSGNVRLGSVTATGNSNAIVAPNNIPSSIVYRLNLVNNLSGYGSIVIPYRAYDGGEYSNVATITVNVAHVNHPPTISAPAVVTTKIGEAATFTVSVTDIDASYPGETARVEIVGSTWGTPAGSANAYAVENAGSTSYTYNGQAASTGSPFAWSIASPYSAGNQITVSGNTVTFRGFSWTPAAGGDPISQTVTIRARDNSNGLSSTVTITFTLTNNNPPVWIQWPGVVTPSLVQGSTWNQQYFSARTADGPEEMRKMNFTVVRAPANGQAWLQTPTGTVGLALTNGVTFSLNGLGATNEYVRYNTSNGGLINFVIRYKGNDAYFGSDTVSFSATTSNGLVTSNYGTATFTTFRQNTKPTSSNIVITGDEEALIPFDIPAQSTNVLSNPVYVVIRDVVFQGSVYQSTGSPDVWSSNSTTAATNGGTVKGFVQGILGYFSPNYPTPIGNFTFQVHEPATGLFSDVYTAQIALRHVNHPPTSAAQSTRIKKREFLTLRLPASDPDADDVDSTLQAQIVSVQPYNGGPSIYFDEALTIPVNSTTIAAGTFLNNRTFYYQSNELFDTAFPLMTYQFRVYDQHGANSPVYFGYIYVDPAGDLPIVGSNVTVTPQETPVPMPLALGVTTESGKTPTVTIKTLPTKGTFSSCNNVGTCTPITAGNHVVPSTTGRVVYTPRDYDWGTAFTTFTYTLTDPGTGAVGTYTMQIDVIHVNKPPVVVAANFLTTAQTTAGVIINESQWRNFDWYAYDVDDTPTNITTTVRITFYTTSGFSLYSCEVTQGAWNSTNCAFDAAADVPEAVRSDFAKNAAVSFSAYEVLDGDCSDDEELKLRYGNASRDCEAHYRFAFVPTPLASYTPYVTITWVAVDPHGAESLPIQALISVKAINDAPTIWAPAQVVGATGITNPFLRDTSQASPTFNNPITVGDVDSNGNTEQLTLQVVSGSGNFSFPAVARCSVAANNSWVCLDRISGFNQWLGDVRFNVTAGDRATLLFTINDLGNYGDYQPSPHLTANATTVVVISAAVRAPTGNSSTLAIAVGVAAGAGLLALGALGFFLRKAVSPPDEDYFSAATAPISSAPTSPLYQAQHSEIMSPIYKGTA